MRKNPGIKKTLELLLKKVETLENQCFAQKLAIDELENKLNIAETHIKQVQENPFNFQSGAPAVSIMTPVPLCVPNYLPASHICTGNGNTTGSTFCTICGASIIKSIEWTLTATSNTTII